jgi:hypothetical protein
VKQVAGRQAKDLLERNLDHELRQWMRMEASGATELQLANQRGVVRGCAMALLSWCNPLYHDSRVMVAEVERIFARRIIEEGQPGA